MTNEIHSHYCPRHKAQIDCARITHCRKAATALCDDCVYEDIQAEKKQKQLKEPIYHSYGGGTFGED